MYMAGDKGFALAKVFLAVEKACALLELSISDLVFTVSNAVSMVR
jgi:hypothetical protein